MAPSCRVTWGDVLTMVQLCPDDAPLRRVWAECGHTLHEHLMLLTQHTLMVANWQRAGDKKLKQPEPPECMVPKELRKTQHIGTASMTLDEANEWLGWGPPQAA